MNWRFSTHWYGIGSAGNAVVRRKSAGMAKRSAGMLALACTLSKRVSMTVAPFSS